MPEKMSIFHGPRIYIRPPQLSDHQAFLAYRNDPEDMEVTVDKPFSLESAMDLLRKQAAAFNKPEGWRMFMIVLRERNQVVGETGAFIRLSERSEADIGWWLHRDYRGNGYATEAANLMLHWCFKVLNVDLATSTCRDDNLASRRVMRRLGMVEGSVTPSVGEIRATLDFETWSNFARNGAGDLLPPSLKSI